MSEEQHLIVEKKDGIAILTLNRASKLNAMTPEMVCRLVDAWDDIGEDDSVRVALVTGAGDRAFSVGGDFDRLTPILNGSRAPQDEWEERVLKEDLLPKMNMRHFPHHKPVICAIKGFCLAGGFEFSLSTDIRVASESAVFGIPEVQLGLMPGTTPTMLPRQVPYAKAMELILTGDLIDAQQAIEIGLVNYVLPVDRVMEKAMEIALRIARNGPLAVQKSKEIALHTRGMPIEDAYEMEWQAATEILATDDVKEGVQAFREKREPNFKSR